MKQKLTRYANGVLASHTGATPRIFLVEQASLARSAVKARADIFQKDGIHLTPKGLNFFNSNILNAMRECYPDRQVQQQAAPGRGGEGGTQNDIIIQPSGIDDDFLVHSTEEAEINLVLSIDAESF